MPYLALDVEAGGTWRYGLDNQCRVGTQRAGALLIACSTSRSHMTLMPPRSIVGSRWHRCRRCARLIVAGYTVEWRGGYHVAAYTGDARAAAVELEDLAQDAPRSDGDVHLWGASTWLRHDACDDAVRDRYAITACDQRHAPVDHRATDSARGSCRLANARLARSPPRSDRTAGRGRKNNAGNNRQQPVSGALTSRRSLE